ncbi:MAG: beta-lactamase family protein [Candidatus Nealsonbacteria bacterium]|nr:beta-lactamase family protein [Candidatus Nealsonbacteria bacterium]
MRLLKQTVFYVVALLWIAAPVAGQALPTATPQQVGLSAEGLERVGPVVQKFIDDEQVAGAVTIVARRGKVAQFEAYGMMDIDTKKPMQKDTIFRIYSMSKPITSVAVMMLYEEGKLKLDDPASKFLPELKGLKVAEDPGADEITKVAPKREMTVRDLLRHTSGLTYGLFGNTAVDKLYRQAGVAGRGDGNLQEFVEKLGKIPLVYQPGAKWNYSVSTDVLGRLVEVVSGRPFDKFLAERIFRPLGMEDTGFYVPADKLDRFATNYGPKLTGGLTVRDAPATSRFAKAPKFFSGGGGLVSTAADYMRFCLMLSGKGQFAGKRLLKTETVELMTRNHLPKEVMPIAFGPAKRLGVGFGLGFSVRVRQTVWESASRVGEYGWGGAASTHFWISPRDELVVVALTQYMPFSDRVERAVKPVVYEAIVEGK